MIKSMTGYGRAQELIEGMNITVEIKSVNSRYLEFSPRIYKNYSFLEEKLKAYVQQLISRGKVECSIQIDAVETDDVIVQINESLASGYINAVNSLAEKYGLENDFTVSQLAQRSDIFQIRKAPADEDKVWEAVRKVLDDATVSFIDMRRKEGEKLRADVLSRADNIISCVEFVEKRSPETVKEYHEKLLTRLRELIQDANIDEQRILTEAAIFADKIAVDEETVRLRSHIDQLRTLMDTDEPVGRKLDFLVQEINREANTIGSKANDIEIAGTVINIKAEVEKIREQIQNIE
ncbi:MAG: YicC family protein [Clostridiales bacterium]|nr:YicC family protein [Clostridiales bacterium]